MIPPPETSFSVSSAVSGGADETSSGTVIDGLLKMREYFATLMIMTSMTVVKLLL